MAYWSLVKDPEEFWGDLSTHGRRLLTELLEGTMEACRDERIGAAWHDPVAGGSARCYAKSPATAQCTGGGQ